MSLDEPCLFCGIAAGTVPAAVVYRGPEVLAFRDIHPQAPVHLLVVPRRHWSGLDDPALPAEALGRLLQVARTLAGEEGLGAGYRVVINTGEDGGQTVGHLHLHVLGGRPLAWPPG